MKLTASATGWPDGAQPAAPVTAANGHAPEPAGRPYWQDEPCPAWCAYPEGHRSHDHPDDRVHMGTSWEIILTLKDPVVTVPLDPAGEIEVSIPRLDAYLQQHWREREPRVDLAVNDEPGILLTLAEAAQLAETLADLVRQAGGTAS